MLGGTMVGCAAQQVKLADRAGTADARAKGLAAEAATKAKAALAGHKTDAAIAAAEDAVRWRPDSPEYRVLLGQAYLMAGRFTSANQAFKDALTLQPSNGRAALNVALTQTALGDWDGAHQTIDAHADIIPAVDRGLALALAGDPATAVDILSDAAREPGANARVRQNLALSLALSGRWTEAKAVASYDLTPDVVDQRIDQWAKIAYPKSASDQVALLLGVTPVVDKGQPTALALRGPMPSVEAPVQMADATPEPAPSTPAVAVSVEAAPASAPAAAAPAMAAAAEPAPQVIAEAVAEVAAAFPEVVPQQRALARVIFGPRREVVQQVPTRQAKAGGRPSTAAPVLVAAKGNYFVQLGAYDNAGVAQDGWARAVRRFPAFADRTPQGMTVQANGATYYRLSVGGYARADADALCRVYRAKGGRCFVRVGEGDQIAQWVKRDRQLAMR